MDPSVWESKHRHLTAEIVSLTNQVLNWTERFNIIVNWINSEFYDLIGLPDEVISAIREDSVCISVCPTRNEKLNTFKERKSKSDKQQKGGTTGLSHNPFISLEKLNVQVIQSLAELNELINHEAIVQSLSEINSAKPTSLTCHASHACSKSFNLNIQLKKHKMCHSNPDENKSLRPRRKVIYSSDSPNSPSRHPNILNFEMTSGDIDSDESDSNYLYDPLGESEIKDDTWSPVNTSDPIDDCLKEEIEIKEEFYEDDLLISQCETTLATDSSVSQIPKKTQLNEKVLTCKFCSKSCRNKT